MLDLHKRINQSEEQMWSCSQGTSPSYWDCGVLKYTLWKGKASRALRDCSTAITCPPQFPRDEYSRRGVFPGCAVPPTGSTGEEALPPPVYRVQQESRGWQRAWEGQNPAALLGLPEHSQTRSRGARRVFGGALRAGKNRLQAVQLLLAQSVCLFAGITSSHSSRMSTQHRPHSESCQCNLESGSSN